MNVFVAGGSEPVMSGKTNDAGLFSFMAVRPGTYDVALEAAGFSRMMVRQVKVSPSQEAGLGAIKLEVQAATTTVEVTADVTAVQLANNEISATVTSTQVQNLPVLGRQVSNLFATQAGVTAGNQPTVVNGLRASFASVSLDGVNIQDNFIRTNSLDYAPMRTTIDQIAEITVSTSNTGAATGGGAAQMVLSTKSGSNTYHGAAYWYNRNSALAANDWFNNQSGVAQKQLNLNQPGASLGGHIIKDKLFFYTNYELFRNKEQSGVTMTTLTDSAKNGIFKYKDSAGNVQSVNLQSIRNFQMDPTVKAMIGQLPSPNIGTKGDGLNSSGYRFNARDNEYRDQFVTRIDYYISPAHSVYGTYNYIDNPTDRPDYGTFFTSVPPVSNTIKNHMLSTSWRWTASPTLTNELRGGMVRANSSFLVSNDYPSYYLSGLLFTSPVNTYMNQGRFTNTYNIQDNAAWLKGKHEISFGFQSQLLRINPWNDLGMLPTYALGISGANTTSLTTKDLPGIRSADVGTANSLYANLAGIISSATQTFNVTGTNSGYVKGANNSRNVSYDTYAGYVQDKWKVLRNLTVNLGLRYEYWTPFNERDSLFLTPVLQNGNVISTILDPNATLDFAGNSVGRPYYKADRNNFAPNAGFAWDPFGKGKTSVRGGYMIGYVNDSIVAAVRNNVNTSAGLSSAPNYQNLVATLANPPAVATPAYKVPRTLADNYAMSTTSATGMPDPNLVTPYVQQWNIGIEHDFKGAIVAVRYVGNHGTKLLRGVDFNQVLYNANGFLSDFQRAQSNAILSQAAGGSFNGAYNSKIAGSQPLTVFPLLANANFGNATVQTYLRQGQVGELANYYQTYKYNGAVNFFMNPMVQGANVMTNSGNSNYNALQFEVTKRTRSGLQLQFNYTYGKALGNTSGDGQTNFEPLLDNKNSRLEYTRSSFDLTHVFKANYYYELPYGNGKHWHGNRVLNTVLGNWAVSGIWSWQSGAPFSILSGYGTLNRSARSSTTNTASVNGTDWATLSQYTGQVFMTGNGPYFVSPSIINMDGDGRGASPAGTAPFSGQVFYNPAAGAVGNTARRMFSGPWQWSWDTSFIKTFKFRERHTLDLHFDVFNWMNHPTFYVYPTTGDYGYSGYESINSTMFGVLDSMNYNPRVVQIGAYYRF